MGTKRERKRARAARWMATPTKRARARTARRMVMATRVAGDKKGNGDGNKEGNGNQRQQHGQWLWQRGWQVFNGGNNGDRAKDMATCNTTGERGMMVVTGNDLCVCFGVCGETTKIRKREKLSLYPRAFRSPPLSKCVFFWQRGFLKARYC